jgi:hypothetical protein
LERFFSSAAKLTSIRVLMAMDETFYIEIDKMDVNTMFLHGDLEEEIYMNHPKEFVVRGKKYFVCKLKIYLYGIKKSPRMWLHHLILK